MRSKNALKNLAASLVCELVIFAFGLIVPRLVILSFGDAVNGLTQTINRLLSLINLIQAGAVGAAIYQMYKPVANNDYRTQSSIIASSNRYFTKVGFVYLAVAMVVALLCGFYLQTDDLSFTEVVLSFVILAINGSLYFFTSKFDIVFSSYQKRYLLTISTLIERLIYYGLLFVVAFGKLHFMFMYLALLFGGIIRVIISSMLYKRLTKGMITKSDCDENFEIKDRKFLMLNSIGNEMITAAPTVIITTFSGLVYSSVFSIYAMIYTSMKTIINTVQLSISAIFGNLVAKSDDEKIARVFNILVYTFTVLGAILASCTAFLFTPFLDIYTANFDSVNYKYPILVLFVVAYVAIFAFKMVFAFVSTVYGLFRDMCKMTLALGAVGVVISIVCTAVFGMPYVMIGVLFFHFSYTVALIRVYTKKIEWFSFRKMGRRIALITVLPTLSYILYYVHPITVSSFFDWIILALIFAVAVAAVLVVYSIIFERREMFALIQYAKRIFKRKSRNS